MFERLPKAPESWVNTSIGDVAEVIRGASPRPKGDPRYFGGTIPWIMISDITSEPGPFLTKTKETVTAEGARKSRCLEPGTLILSNSATICVPKILKVKGCIHDGFVAFPKLNKSIDKLYLYYYFEYIRPFIVKDITQGVTQVNLNTTIVKNIPFLLPPLAEQRRIINKIEKLENQLNKEKRTLETAKEKCGIFVQSLFKSAFSGALSKSWRHNNGPFISTGQNEYFNKIAKSEKIEVSFPHALPKTWHWTSMGDASEIIMGQSPPGDSYNNTGIGTPLINGPVEFNSGRLARTSNLKFTTAPTKMCKQDDLIICVRGSTTGRTNTASSDACIGRGVAAIRSNKSQQYLNYYIHSIESKILRMGTGSTFPNVNKDMIENIPFPEAPLDEQIAIAKMLDISLDYMDSAIIAINISLNRIGLLHKSILNEAFTGNLVPQDPTDEPASVLLERINTERTMKPRTKSSRQVKFT